MSKVRASSHEYSHVEKTKCLREQNFKGEANNNKQLDSEDTPQKDFSSQYLSLHVTLVGRRVSAVVRALASHQCGLGSIPGTSVICGLILMLVISTLLREVFLWVLRFSPPKKTNISGHF